MELPQPSPVEAEGKKPPVDFLTLYSNSSQRQNPDPSHGFGLKTYNFLQPLEQERVEKCSSIGDARETSSQLVGQYHHNASEIHYSTISHISSFNSLVVKPESSACSMIQESSVDRFAKGGKTINNSCSYEKEDCSLKNKAADTSQKSARFQPFVSGAGGFVSVASSDNHLEQKKELMMEFMKVVKGPPADEEGGGEDCVKKESSSQQGEIVKTDSISYEHKAYTPRSKHSATEQRRRSKINNRFQILRQLIPQSDQKRDKASFLLEVIEHIQLLQARLHKYEAAFPGCNFDRMQLMPWKQSDGPGEDVPDHSRAAKDGADPASILPLKDNDENGFVTSSPMLGNNTQKPNESEILRMGANKEMDCYFDSANKAASVPNDLQQSVYTSVIRNNGATQPQQGATLDAENKFFQSKNHLWHGSSADFDILNEQDLAIEGGTIRVSAIYSEGLLNALELALQSSGIDLSQANVAVQVDLGKRAVKNPSLTTTSAKDHEDPSSCNLTIAHSRVTSSCEDSDQAQKRLKR